MNKHRGALSICLGIVASTAVCAQPSFEAGDGWRGEAANGDLSWRLGGRFHLDSAQYDADITPLEDDTDLRRARLSFRAQLREDWRFAADYEFADVGTGWKSLNAQYRGWDDWRMTIGNQIVPFSMEENTGSDELGLLERALPNALSPGILTGVSFQTLGRRWAFTGGAFANELSDQERRRADGQSIALRFTTSPIRNDDTVLHLGIATELREIDDSIIRLRARPESYLTRQRLIDTGSIAGVDGLDTLGLEIGGKRGPFSIRAEYIRATAARAAALTDVNFDGGYVAVGYVLTGESLSYSRRSGTFGGIEPRGRFGAVELVARTSSLDLTDSDVLGGFERNHSIGVNWYLRDSLRFMVNFVEIDASPNRDGVDESPSVIQLRFQANL
jgi:phosphate-selective porin OprO/OprP